MDDGEAAVHNVDSLVFSKHGVFIEVQPQWALSIKIRRKTGLAVWKETAASDLGRLMEFSLPTLDSIRHGYEQFSLFLAKFNIAEEV